MADVLVNALTPITTEPISTDSIVCVDRSTNEGKIIDYNLLADVILDKLAGHSSDVQSISLGTGESIPSNSNLNNYTTPGRYYTGSGTVTQTLTNIPADVTTGIVLIVEAGTASNYIRQRIYPNLNLLRYYERLNSGGTWGDWYQFAGATNKPFLLKNYSYQYTLAAGASTGLTTSDFGIEAINGYAGIILRYWTTGNEHIVAYSANATSNTSGNNVTVLRLTNMYSSSITATATVSMIFVSSNFFGNV